jgi:5-formyltetrahydrofolate cyclo-ligase
MRHEDLLKRKRDLRVELLADLSSQGNKQESSRQIVERLIALPEFLAAKTVSAYVSTAAEVQTHEFIERCWEQRKRVAVPCCLQGELHLFRLDAMRDLVPRTLGILEPGAELRRNTERRIYPSQVDLFIVPGVAFDHAGGRLGHGKGYYDRLLGRATSTAHKIGLAFECQVIQQVPMGANDVFLNAVITEDAVHRR